MQATKRRDKLLKTSSKDCRPGDTLEMIAAGSGANKDFEGTIAKVVSTQSGYQENIHVELISLPKAARHFYPDLGKTTFQLTGAWGFYVLEEMDWDE